MYHVIEIDQHSGCVPTAAMTAFVSGTESPFPPTLSCPKLVKLVNSGALVATSLPLSAQQSIASASSSVIQLSSLCIAIM
jgi:hypothetical protein